MKNYFFAVLIGFLLPWQTRFILQTPLVDGVVWDFGIISIFISQIVIVCWILFHTKQIIDFCKKISWSREVKIITASIFLLVIAQSIFSENRLLTLQWIFGAASLVGLGLLLRKYEYTRIPFAGAFLVSIVLQALLAAMQVFSGATFGSALLGIAEHRSSISGTAVIDYAGIRYLRAYGGQPHPNIFGGLLLVGLMLFGWLLKNKRTLGVKKNIVQYVVVICGTLFFTFSRSAWIAFIVWIFLLIIYRKKLRESEITEGKWAFITFSILAVMFFPIVVSRTMPTTSIEQRSISERVTEVSSWKKVLKEDWVFGTGLGAYTAALSTGSDRHVPIHSVGALAFAELGVFGTVCFLVAAWIYRKKIHNFFVFIPLIPIALFDHYLFSLWSGHVILFMTVFQMFQVSNDDEADNDKK